MAMTRAEIPAALDANIERSILLNFTEAALAYQGYNNNETSGKQTETVAAYGSFGAMPQKPEGTAYPTDSFEQRYTQGFTHTSYGMAFTVTEEMLEDDLTRLILRMAASLGRSAAETMGVKGASILNNGFSNSFLYGDGIELFSAVHPTSGGTTRNELATPADLGVASLDEARYTLGLTPDHRGKLLNIQAAKLITPGQLEKTGSQILGSDLEYGTTDNQQNFFKGKMSQVTDYQLTDVDAWFLQAVEHGITNFTRRSFRQGQYREDSTGNTVYWADFRQSWGVEFWRGTFGTEGAA